MTGRPFTGLRAAEVSLAGAAERAITCATPAAAIDAGSLARAAAGAHTAAALASFAWPLGECRMRVELAIDGTEVALGRNDALQHGASEGDVKYISRRQVVLKAEGGLVAARRARVRDPRGQFDERGAPSAALLAALARAHAGPRG